MAGLILKSPYMKPNAKGHIKTYLNYIATREGVEKIDETYTDLCRTKKQEKIIARLVKNYPDSKDLFEYKDYMKSPTRKNADELISRISEMNGELLGGIENYIGYIAKRPRVENVSTHGLFSDEGVPIILAKVKKEAAESRSNIWTHIISLKREDAERLGYDNASAWMQLLRSNRNMIAKNMKIKPENFRWYAAFHNESHHPHVHMVAYSVDPKEAYLTEKGIREIKSTLANDIFRQDLISIYDRQNIYRDALRSESKERMSEIIKEIKTGTFENKHLEEMLMMLNSILSRARGKKQYGYLSANIKNAVDDIVIELSKDERLSELYNLWYEEKEKTIRVYTDNTPRRIPLVDNPEFKSIKNAVIQEALNISKDGNDGSLNNISPKIVSGIMNLMYYVGNLFRDKINTDHPAKIDRKERQKTNEKKQAQGLKL